MYATVPIVEELLAVNRDHRQQVKHDADLIVAPQLQLQEKDGIISVLREFRLAAAKSAPVMEGQSFTSVSKGESDCTAAFATPGRGLNYVKKIIASFSISWNAKWIISELTREENRSTSMHTPSSHSSVDVDKLGVQMNDVRHVLISAISSAVAPSQGQLVGHYNYHGKTY